VLPDLPGARLERVDGGEMNLAGGEMMLSHNHVFAFQQIQSMRNYYSYWRKPG